MKIRNITLRNFSSIKLAMECDELYVSFENCVNTICLLIGPNGSGKTSLLSMMHPFADQGNLDVRNGYELIRKGKDGYKEITIDDGDDVYTIKHFYSPHEGKSHSVKSYIMKNGVELNINGNVTSFKEYVKEELSIEPEYLKLIRLGTNVTSLIGLSATDRKTFMSKLLDDIGVFLDQYKSVNNKMRELKDRISHDVYKLNKLQIDDPSVIKKLVENLRLELDTEQKNYEADYGVASVCNHIINEIEDSVSLYSRLTDANRKLSKMNKVLEKKDSLDSTDSTYYEKKIQELENENLQLLTMIDSHDSIIKSNIEVLNQYQEQYRDFEIQGKKEQEKDKEIDNLIKQRNAIRVEANELEENLDGFKPNFSKDDFDKFVIFLKNTQQALDRTYEFGKKSVSKVISLMREKSNVMNYVNSHLIACGDSADTEESLFLHTLAKRFDFNKDFKDCNNKTCEARALYIQVANLLNQRNEKDKKEDSTFYRDMEMVFYNLKSILMDFSLYSDVINQLPKNMKEKFEMTYIYKTIEKSDKIYDEKELNSMISLMTEYETYKNALKSIEELEAEIKKCQNQSESEYVLDLLLKTNERIEALRDKNIDEKESIVREREKIEENKKTIEFYTDLQETFEKYDSLREESSRLEKEYETYRVNKDKLKEYEERMKYIKSKIETINFQIQEYENALNQFKILKKELKKYNEVYDDLTFVKQSFSSKDGMPLRYIEDYLGDVKEDTNELLNIAYNGRIELCDFDISPDSFKMPFMNKGKVIDDIVYASQGETSFLGISLSFALARKAMKGYNIMLLDEVDGPLDIDNRQKFIDVMEKQIEKLHGEQNFLTTHNSMFSSYPVDIIDLSFTNKTDEYKLATFVQIIRK